MVDVRGELREFPERCLHCPAFNRVLLVRDGSTDGADVAAALQPLGLQVHVVAAGSALAQIDELDYEFVLWDSQGPNAEVVAAMQQMLRQCPRLPIIVLTQDAQAETAIEMIKAGAHDLLAKPFQSPQLQATVNRALQTRRLLCDALLIPGIPQAQVMPVKFVGRSPTMQAVFKQIGLVARRDESVLILGETGTGKELVARTIHRHSKRCESPFLAINCAAVPESLLESELFGHEKGAFTGATQRRLGAFECAHKGTLFLDEIGDMSLPLQAKILRALQHEGIHRLGGHETIDVDVRVLTATNKSLEKAIHEGSFRDDLYYRLNVVSIRLPPLREHREDILELVEYFLERYTPVGDPRPALDAQALRKLQAHAWPGNVRELENVIRRALVTAKGQAIMEKDIALGEPGSRVALCDTAQCAHCQNVPISAPADDGAAQERALDEQLSVVLRQWLAHQVRNPALDQGSNLPTRMEAKMLHMALELTHGNQVKAARLLGISRTTLRQWLTRKESRTD